MVQKSMSMQDYMKKNIGNRGFTLFEIMIVVAIMGIIAAIATPILLSQLPEMNLKSAARDLYSSLMEAKVLALKNGVPVSVQFLQPLPPSCVNGPNPAIPPYIITYTDPITGTLVCVSTPGALPSGVVFSPPNAPITLFNDTLLFSAQGIPTDINNAELGAQQQVVLNAVNSSGAVLQTHTVTVTISGGITLQ